MTYSQQKGVVMVMWLLKFCR